MKKLLSLILCTCFLYSCNKREDENLQYQDDKLTFKGGGIGLPGISFTVEFRAGHDPKTGPCCSNYPLCVSAPFNCGALLHTPCTGPGSNCGWTIGIGQCDTGNYGGIQQSLAILSKSAYDESVFNFPAFSYEIGMNKYFNVPAQLAEKASVLDSQSVVFTLQNVTLTSEPLY